MRPGAMLSRLETRMGHDKDNAAEVERLRQARIERERKTRVPDGKVLDIQVRVPDDDKPTDPYRSRD
jgi:hypothetical protein